MSHAPLGFLSMLTGFQNAEEAAGTSPYPSPNRFRIPKKSPCTDHENTALGYSCTPLEMVDLETACGFDEPR
jgi:hypothetical protein